jgi:1-acyl-sn-glycerol-3-phosphate acyltransferase
MGRTFLRVFGWELEGGRPGVQRAVVIAYPHTTNWDLPFTIACAYALDVDIKWLGKKAIFKWPLGWFMKKLGGIPVDRTRRTNLVDAVIEAIEPLDDVLVVIPPEGTRGKAGRWKSGFYWIADGAGIPIILGFLDYGRKRGGLGEVFEPTGDIHADFEKIEAFYRGMEGKYPDKQGPITLVDE